MIDLKTLEALLKLCRRQGVLSLDTQDIKFTLSEVAPKPTTRAAKQNEPLNEEAFEWDDLDEEQKLFWSSLPSNSGEKA